MRKNQKGFAIIEITLILVVVAIIGGIGYYVWHTKTLTDKSLSLSDNSVQSLSNEPEYTNQNPDSMPLDAFNDCAKTQKNGATLNDLGTTLNCTSKEGYKYNQPALETIRTVSANFSRPTYAQLPESFRAFIVAMAPQDCSFNNVSIDSPKDSAAKAMQAGNYLKIAIGCGGAGTFDYKLSNGTWGKLGFPADKDFCTNIANEQYPIELMLNTFDPAVSNPIAKCTDNFRIEHQIVAE